MLGRYDWRLWRDFEGKLLWWAELAQSFRELAGEESSLLIPRSENRSLSSLEHNKFQIYAMQYPKSNKNFRNTRLTCCLRQNNPRFNPRLFKFNVVEGKGFRWALSSFFFLSFCQVEASWLCDTNMNGEKFLKEVFPFISDFLSSIMCQTFLHSSVASFRREARGKQIN